MSTDAQPTAEVSARPSAGAMRAAEVIAPYASDWPPYRMLTRDVQAANVAEIARVIDRETAAPTLLAACIDAIRQYESGQGVGDLSLLRAAISAATKGAS